MPDYQQGKIYTIRCINDDALIYVGSTIQPLSKRWGGHKTKSLKHPNRLIYKSIDNKWEEWYIELYELYPCNSKMELEKREGEVIREIGTLNQKISGRTPKEYYNDNIDTITEYKKKYNEDNQYKIKEYQKKYFQQYYKNNIDKFNEKDKLYNINNKDKIKEKNRLYYQRKKQEQNQAE